MRFAASTFSIAALFLLFSQARLPAQSRVPVNVGQSSSNPAGFGFSYFVVVHNRTGVIRNVRYYTKDWQYSGPNWMWYYPDLTHGQAYWQSNPDAADWRFTTSSARSGAPSVSFSVPAGSDSRLSGYWGGNFHYNGYQINQSHPVTAPSATTYVFQAMGETVPLDFEYSFTMVLEVFQNGTWIYLDEKPVTIRRSLAVTLVPGSVWGSYEGPPVFVEFDVGGDSRPVKKPPASCGIPGAAGNKLGSVDLSFKLGGDKFGDSPVQLGLALGRIDSSVYDPRYLTLSGAGKFAKVCDQAVTGHPLRQLQTQDDVVVVADASATDEQVELRFFLRDPSWTQPLGMLVDVGTAVPHTTVTILNPDRSLATHDKLRAIRVSGTRTDTWDYTNTNANTWEMVSEDGTRRETLAYEPTGDPLVTTETWTVLDVTNNALLSKVITTWKSFGFGTAPISRILDPDGRALTTTWDYYMNAGAASSYGQVQRQVDPSGFWTEYTYDSLLPSVVKTVQTYLGTPVGTPESQCRTKTRTLNVSGGPAGAGMTLETEKVSNIIVSRRFVVENPDGYDEIQCLTQTAAWNDAANLVTKTRYCTDSVFQTRLKSVIRPDGTGVICSYQIDGTSLDDSTQLTAVVAEGALNADATAVTDGIRTTTLTNKEGSVIFREVTDIVSGRLLDRQLASTTDGFGRPTYEQFLDGTTQQTSYGCCGIESRTDRRGIVTTFADFTQSHTTTRTSQGITAKTQTSGLSVINSRIGTDNSEIQISADQYNFAGELISRTVSAGGSAAYATSIDGSGLTVSTTTYADGGTRIDTLYPDSSPKSVTGTAIAPVRFDYGVEADGATWVKIIALDAQGNDTPEWVKTWSDLGGRVFKTDRSGAGSSTVYFNSKGQVHQAIDADGVTSLWTYDARGRQRRAVLDMNRNGSVDEGSADRIVQSDTSITSRPDGRDVERTVLTVWTEEDDAVATAVVSTTDRAVDGLDIWVTANGVTTQSHLAYSGNGAWTETLAEAGGSMVIRSYAGGRLAAETWKDSGGVTMALSSNTYDAHGRLAQTQDGRGATITYAFDPEDRMYSITGPAPVSGGGGPLTTIDYDSMGREQTVTDAENGIETTAYFPTGAVQSVSGNRAYPVSYTYTAQGRIASMTTASGTTTWVYNAMTGRLWKKRDTSNKGPVFTYTAAGRLETRVDARGIMTSYGHDNAGRNNTVNYNDGVTPSVTTHFNRLGQPFKVVSGDVFTELAFNVWGQLQTEAFTGGPFDGLGVAHGYDVLRRPSGVAAVLGSTTLSGQGYAYDDASRLKVVSGGGQTAFYDYDSAGGGLVSQVTLQQGGVTRMTSPRHYDLAGRLDWMKALNAADAELFRAGYNYNAIDQRTAVTREDNTQWAWGYNERGEVITGEKKFSDGASHPVLQYGYRYDDIGNRTQSSAGVPPVNGPPANDPHTTVYATNTLNQYSDRSMPSLLAVTGEAAADANVVIQGRAAQRNGSAFWREWSADNATGPVRENVRVAAAKPGAGSNGADLASLQTGVLYLPPATEIFTYDDEGNMTGDSRWTYVWDGENRLLSMQEKSAALPAGWALQHIDFGYDAGGRRVRKTVKRWNGSAWLVTADTGFVYDGWNLIAELDLTGGSPQLLRSYGWGLDLSGSPQGAGGVGGLLWAKSESSGGSQVHYPAYDGNGNIIGYVDAADGSPVLKLDYDPFGKAVMVASMGAAASSAAARELPFRFSTKYLDRETGLSYYGYRYYSAELGRWINRDPLGEVGGENLYKFTNNNLTNSYDLLGLFESDGHYYVPFIIARLNGYSVEQAQRIAYYAQYPDQDPRFDAKEAGMRRKIPFLNEEQIDKDVQEVLHQLDGLSSQRQQCCIRNYIQTNWDELKDWERGLLIHALGDSSAHTKPDGKHYIAPYGHTKDSLVGIDPDDPANNTARFRIYIGDLNAVLGGAASPMELNKIASALSKRHTRLVPFEDGTQVPVVDRTAAKATARMLAQSFGLSDSFDPDDKRNRLDPKKSVLMPSQIRELIDKLKSACY